MAYVCVVPIHHPHSSAATKMGHGISRAETAAEDNPGMEGTMKEWKAGTLHSGSKSGPIVKNRKQAIAIGLSQERRGK